jgi:hypothetical protein
MTSQSDIGAKYHDTNGVVVPVLEEQGPSERFEDALNDFGGMLASSLTSSPKGSDESEPSGIPTSDSSNKVTKWKGTDGIWHWVKTPQNGLSAQEWQTTHDQRVTAAQVDFPPAG